MHDQRPLSPTPTLMRSAKLPIQVAIFFALLIAASALAQTGAAEPGTPPADSASSLSAPVASPTVLPAAPAAQPATVSGTVLDTNDDIVPGAKISVETAAGGSVNTAVSNDNAAFTIYGLQPGTAYIFKVSAPGFVDWTSAPVTLQAGQFLFLRDVRLKVKADATSVTVYGSNRQIATQQVMLEEQQRVLGFVPNYYVNYDGANAAPLPAKMKFQLALRTARDPVTIGGVFLLAGMYQAGATPGFRQGAAGYGERVAAIGADGVTNIMIGGAILPSLLHQDPRYFYQGTGSTRSRLLHALTAPLIARGDNGRQQINVSSMGGDLSTAALMNTWYPSEDRGAGLVFGNFALATGERAINGVIQEFLLPHFTSRGKQD